MKDHIILKTQKDFKDGNDIATAIVEGKEDAPISKPTRLYVRCTDVNSKTDVEKMNMEVKQQGYDIEYTEELREYNERKKLYSSNMVKAYALIFSLCIKTMQSRIEEMSNFEKEIKNNPIKLLEAIKEKMHDPSRVKHEYATLTESIARVLVGTKQEFDEDLVSLHKEI